MADSRPGTRRIQDEIEYIVVPESKEVLKEMKNGQWPKLEKFEYWIIIL